MAERLASRIVAGVAGDITNGKSRSDERLMGSTEYDRRCAVWEGNADEDNAGTKYAVTRW